MFVTVFKVGFVGIPAKVCNRVIQRIAVIVTSFHPDRASTNKSFKHEPVNPF